MCLICIELQKDKLTIPEAMRNLTEMRQSIGEEHARIVDDLIHERALRELDELLKDFDPFVGPPNSLLERYSEKSVNPDFYGVVNILPADDEPLELEFEDILTSSW